MLDQILDQYQVVQHGVSMDSVYYRRLDREAYLLFSALQQQKNFAEAVDAAFGDSKLSSDEQSQKFGNTLCSRLSSGGLLDENKSVDERGDAIANCGSSYKHSENEKSVQPRSSRSQATQ